MDQSLDSIGSCSLDVDCDSSDTSDSLNCTPHIVPEICKESAGDFVRVTSMSSKPRVYTTVMQPTKATTETNNINQIIAEESIEKKPSYLNLACCVNGYSNLTTYDSKVRQDINKSREISPIRPSTCGIQYCKKQELLAPVILTMPKTNNIISNSSNSNKNNGDLKNGSNVYHENVVGGSFIQQRVERLYGQGALAQGFYSPRKMQKRPPTQLNTSKDTTDSTDDKELLKKFQELSTNKDYSAFQKKLSQNISQPKSTEELCSVDICNQTDVDLPVLRHLSQEFRSQLPELLPKKIHSPQNSSSINNLIKLQYNNTPNASGMCNELVDIVDCTVITTDAVRPAATKLPITSNIHKKEENLESEGVQYCSEAVSTIALPQKDGPYFINLLKNEQARLLLLANDAEQYIESLTNNPDITEDIFGLLRAASGKSRLLVSQKMKQFEGLCHNHMNHSAEEKFPTTLNDLQGFWDMVNLQVEHIDSIFVDIEVLKKNGWKKPNEKSSDTPVKPQKLSKTPNTKAKNNCNGNNTKTPSSTITAGLALKREEQRKRLMELKRKNKLALAANSDAAGHDQITAPNLESIKIYTNNDI